MEPKIAFVERRAKTFMKASRLALLDTTNGLTYTHSLFVEVQLNTVVIVIAVVVVVAKAK